MASLSCVIPFLLRSFSPPLLATTLLIAQVPSISALWPQPQQLSAGSAPLHLAPDFSIDLSGVYDPPRDLIDAVTRTQQYLQRDKLQFLAPDRGASYAGSIYNANTLSKLAVSHAGGSVKSISQEVVQDLESRVEDYSLTVPENGGTAVLRANSTLGLFRGLTTFSQLWYDWDGTTYMLNAPIAIVDKPAYPYRGFMLDTARNYFPVPDIKRLLDAMSWVKMNTFHWHVVDAQSFPLVVPGFEEISQKGAYSPTFIYSQSDVADIIQYAATRGIDVIAEIDTPGHTSVIHKSHPEHVACPEATPWAHFANEPPAGQLRFASSATTNFTASLLSSASSLFPSKYFSTGGDELNVNCYTEDIQTQQELTQQNKTLEQALDGFVQVTHETLREKGKTPVVWEEMALVHNVTLGNDTLVMVWISSQNVEAVAQKGFRVIHAASDYFYLDCGAGGWVGDFVNGNSWCEPFKTWQKAYSFNPVANLTDAQSKLILGGEHLLWTEQSGPSNLDPIAWPRAAASAELWWTGPGGNVDTALPRLHELSFRFSQRGVRTIPLQPLWCALRPGVCDLDA